MDENESIDYDVFLDMSILEDAIHMLKVKISKIPEESVKRRIDTTLALIRCLLQNNQFDEGRDYCKNLLKIDMKKEVPQFEKLYHSRIYYLLAAIHNRKSAIFESMKYINLSIDLQRELDVKNYELNLCLVLRGNLYRSLGKFKKSNDDWHESIELASKSLDPESFLLKELSFCFIEVVFMTVQELEKLLKQYKESIDKKITLFGERHQVIARNYN
mmetsp:Transcript_32624/g.29497  ORF Transcript_32624/g.29497 Transcript_32624/m.29497 type:complete len:216 (-) Transcript_32624:1168-1815(-)